MQIKQRKAVGIATMVAIGVAALFAIYVTYGAVHSLLNPIPGDFWQNLVTGAIAIIASIIVAAIFGAIMAVIGMWAGLKVE